MQWSCQGINNSRVLWCTDCSLSFAHSYLLQLPEGYTSEQCLTGMFLLSTELSAIVKRSKTSASLGSSTLRLRASSSLTLIDPQLRSYHSSKVLHALLTQNCALLHTPISSGWSDTFRSAIQIIPCRSAHATAKPLFRLSLPALRRDILKLSLPYWTNWIQVFLCTSSAISSLAFHLLLPLAPLYP